MRTGHLALDLATGPSRGDVQRVAHAARAFVESWPIQFLTRFGYVVRGVIYFIPGLLALDLAVRRRGATLAPTGAIAMIGHEPFGRGLLLVVMAGLIGYAIWGLTRALLDPWGRGTSLRGIGRRIGYAISGLAYMSFVVLTTHLLLGDTADADQARAWVARALAAPMGGWILGAVGLGWILFAGLSEIGFGLTGGFERDLRWERMHVREHRWAVALGRIGIAGRGVIFAVIGLLLVTAALQHDPRRGGGMGEALEAIARQAFGRTLLALAAAGLMIFGVFSVLCARWMRTRSGLSQIRPPGRFHTREVRHGHV